MATRTQRGVSPLVGTVLLIALTVTTATVVAAVTLETGQTLEADDPWLEAADAPDADFAFTPTGDQLLVEHAGGEPVDGDRLTVGDADPWSGTVTEGDTATVERTDHVTVEWHADTPETVVLAEYST